MLGYQPPTVAEIIQGLDASVSPLGPRSGWPACLRAAVDLILPAQAEIVLFWGPDYVALYNDAYAPTIGDKHPGAFGRPAIEYWRELWDDLEPLLSGVRRTGETFHAKDRPFYIERSGGVGETVYFDVSYSPLKGEDGGVEGVLCIVSETTARVRALERAAHSEAQLQAIADSIDQMIWSTRPDGYHDYYNRRWYEYTGVPPGSTDGQAWNDMFHPDDRQEAWAVWRRSLETGEPYHIQYRLRRHDGQYRWVLGRAQAVRDADGRIQRWYGTCTDIHDLKTARDALQDERNALEILNGVAGRVAVQFDLDKLVQTVADAGVELSGAEFGAFFYNVLGAPEGDAIRYAFSGADRSEFERFLHPRYTAVFAAAVKGRSAVRVDDIARDRRLRRPEAAGSRLPVRSYLAAPVRLRSGEVVGGLFFGHGQVGAFDDRGERLIQGLAAHAAIGIDTSRLVQRLQRLNAGLEDEVAARTAERDQVWGASHDLLIESGLDGVFRSVNPAWQRCLGWRADELEGRRYDWLIHPDDLAATRAQTARLARGETTASFENRYRARDGGYRILAWTAVRSGDRVYGVGRDVTAEHRRRQELAETQERLRQAQKMETVGQLTGGVAHDFNNLLQVVTGNLEILQRNLPADQPRLRRAADSAMTGARRAATLTQRLLAFARRQPLNPRPLDLNRLVLGMSELLYRTLGETIDVETVLSAGAWRIEADANGLENAILNLAVNARDAMPDGGKLTIETANASIDGAYARRNLEVTPGQYVMFSVSDTGHGMSPEVAERAFEPFYTTKEVGRGTGLGLSMVYGFAKQSGGHVKIYSEVGQGTTVRLYFPRLAAGAEVEEQEAQVWAPPGENCETILVCEDDDDVRAYSVEALRELGYRVLEAHDGPSALRLLERQDGRVDLLFTDVILPSGMTGAEVAAAARRVQPGLPILFTTGYARNAIVHQGRLDAGVELITKPFAFADLAARIREILDTARASALS